MHKHTSAPSLHLKDWLLIGSGLSLSLGLYLNFNAFFEPYRLNVTTIIIALSTAFFFNPLSLLYLTPWKNLSPGLQLFIGLFMISCLYIGCFLISWISFIYYPNSVGMPLFICLFILSSAGLWLLIKKSAVTKTLRERSLAIASALIAVGIILSFKATTDPYLFSYLTTHRILFITFLLLPIGISFLIPWNTICFSTAVTIGLLLTSCTFIETSLLLSIYWQYP